MVKSFPDMPCNAFVIVHSNAPAPAQSVMRFLFNPDDWLGRHPNVCLLLLAAVVLIGGAL